MNKLEIEVNFSQKLNLDLKSSDQYLEQVWQYEIRKAILRAQWGLMERYLYVYLDGRKVISYLRQRLIIAIHYSELCHQLHYDSNIVNIVQWTYSWF